MKKALMIICSLAFLIGFWPVKAQAFIPTMEKMSPPPTATPTPATNGDNPSDGYTEDIPPEEYVDTTDPGTSVEENTTTDTSDSSSKNTSVKKKSSSFNIFATVWDWIKSHLKPTYCLSKFWFWFLVLVPIPLILILLLIIFILLLRGPKERAPSSPSVNPAKK